MSTAMADPAMDPQAAAEAAAQAALFQWAVREITTPVVVASFIACLLYGVLLYMGACLSPHSALTTWSQS